MGDFKRFVTEQLGMAVICALFNLIMAEGHLKLWGGGTDCRKAGRLRFSC